MIPIGLLAGKGATALRAAFDDALDSGLAEYFESYYPSEWTTLEDQLVGGYLGTDLTGSKDIYNVNYGYIFEMDSDGEIVLDTDGYLSPLDAADSEEFMDGYYRLYVGYGFTL